APLLARDAAVGARAALRVGLLRPLKASVVLSAVEAGAAVWLRGVGGRRALAGAVANAAYADVLVGTFVVGHGRVFVPPLGARRPRPRAHWTTFATGVTARTKYVARPMTSSAVGRAASRPSGVDGSPSSTTYATPSSSVEWASDTATPGSPCSLANAAARSLPSPTMIRALWASTQSTSGARSAGPARPVEPAGAASAEASSSAASRASALPSLPASSDPRYLSNGCGIPTRPPWARIAAIASAGASPLSIASRRNTAIKSPDEVRTSWPTRIATPSPSRAP